MVKGIRSTCLHRRGCGGRIREVGHGGWKSEPPITKPSHFAGSSPRSCEHIIRVSGCAVRTQRSSGMKDWRHANRLRGSRKGCDAGGHSIAVQGFGGGFWCRRFGAQKPSTQNNSTFKSTSSHPIQDLSTRLPGASMT